MNVAAELAPTVGIVAVCKALGVPRASYYRRHQPVWLPITSTLLEPRSPSPRGLSLTERHSIRDVLNSSRFVDLAPAQIYTALLDEGVFLCSVRSMYRRVRSQYCALYAAISRCGAAVFLWVRGWSLARALSIRR